MKKSMPAYWCVLWLFALGSSHAFAQALNGDFNSDGLVNGQDIATLAIRLGERLGAPGGNTYYPSGDMNNDGIVNIEDAALFLPNWFQISSTYNSASPAMGDSFGPTIPLPTKAGPNNTVIPIVPSVTLSYVNVIGTDVSGHTISYSPNSPIVIASGTKLSFGIAVSVTGDPDHNSAAGGAWDFANQQAGNPALPENLGLGCIGITIPSDDKTGSILAPVAHGGLALGSLTAKFAAVTPNQITAGGSIDGGQIGVNGAGTVVSPIGWFDDPSAGYGRNVSGPGGFGDVGAFAGSGPQTLFTGLTYSAMGTGTVMLSPTVDNDGTDLWAVEFAGDSDGDSPVFLNQTVAQEYFDPPLQPLTIQVIPVPEPSSLAMVLTAAFGLGSWQKKR